MTIRKSCFTCHYPSNHYSDVTIWDAWNIRGDDDRGSSAVKINTEKGEKVFKLIYKNLVKVAPLKKKNIKSILLYMTI